MLSFCLFVFPLMGKAEWGGNPVCWWLGLYFCFVWTSLVVQTVKHLSTVRETWVWSLGQEAPLEKEMAIHPSTIAWKIPLTEEPRRLQSMGLQRVGHDWATSLSFPFFLLFRWGVLHRVLLVVGWCWVLCSGGFLCMSLILPRVSSLGEGNGNPLQCSYLENPRDGGAWWATVYGVAQSRTRLRQLSSSSRVSSLVV